MQHAQTYSKWDVLHEPYNVIENILEDNEKVYKALTPNFDLTLDDGRPCFVANVTVHPGDCGPASVEIYISNLQESWSMVKKFNAMKDRPSTFVLPGENVAKFVRVRCVNNVRGGNLVNLRYVQVKGLTSEQIPPQDNYM